MVRLFAFIVVTLPENVTLPVTVKDDDIVTGPVIFPPEVLNLIFAVS